MDTLTIRQKLYEYVKIAGDEKVEAIYTIIKDDVSIPYEWWNDDGLVAELDQRAADLKSGKDKGAPWNEVKERLLSKNNSVKNAIIFSSIAEKEIDESFSWYESRSMGLDEQIQKVVNCSNLVVKYVII